MTLIGLIVLMQVIFSTLDSHHTLGSEHLASYKMMHVIVTSGLPSPSITSSLTILHPKILWQRDCPVRTYKAVLTAMVISTFVNM